MKAESTTSVQWGAWFSGFAIFGGTDVLEHWDVPCFSDGANLVNTGFNIYKYMDSYTATNDSTYILPAVGQLGMGVE